MSETYPTRAVARRPALLSIVTILITVAGIVSVVTGVVAIALRNSPDVRVEIEETPASAMAAGVILVVTGLISVPWQRRCGASDLAVRGLEHASCPASAPVGQIRRLPVGAGIEE